MELFSLKTLRSCCGGAAPPAAAAGADRDGYRIEPRLFKVDGELIELRTAFFEPPHISEDQENYFGFDGAWSGAMHMSTYSVGWVLDDQITRCNLCRGAFNAFNWRHHCRICGWVVCRRCSSHRVVILIGTRERHVVLEAAGSRTCDKCFQEHGLLDVANRSAALASSTIPHRPSTNASFFRLPLDLHLLVLHTWVEEPTDSRSMARILSRLDIACCNHSLREHLLDILSSPLLLPRPFQVGKQLRGLIQWIVTRKVIVRTLVLINCYFSSLEGWARGKGQSPPFAMNSVTRLDLGVIDDSALGLEMLLRICPHLTSLSHRNYGVVVFWTALTAVSPPQLRVLEVNSTSLAPASDMLNRLYHNFGRDCSHHIVQLRLPNTLFSGELCVALQRFCHQLTLLELCVVNASTFIAVFLSHCTLLETCMLRHCDGPFVDFMTLIHAAASDKPAFEQFAIDYSVNFDVFAQLLEQYPKMKRLEFHNFSFDRSSGRLLLNPSLAPSSAPFHYDSLEQVLSTCSVVKDLYVVGQLQSSQWGDSSLHSLLESKIHTHLEALTLFDVSRDNMLNMDIMSQQPWYALKRINLIAKVWDASLQVIVYHCKQVEFIRLDSLHSMQVTDVGLNLLLSHCSCLSELELGTAPLVTQSVLNTILLYGCRLKKFTWRDTAISPKDTKIFRRMAKDKGIAPITILARNEGYTTYS